MPPGATLPLVQFPPAVAVTVVLPPFSAYTLLALVVPVFRVPTKTTSGVTPQTDSDLSACSQTAAPPCSMLFAARDGLCHTCAPVPVFTAYTNPSWDET